eukprot:CAMPEP_0168434860 /NCGR_PEP_ID=MMETSP0228-20121227/40121_1 /TAXON_ID=133427 /ORGANISM="Protoceratium reticulatum, Strain CCCM 535 (=CCMP 1889)" /LENGTH=107 /DNA_ID=CAMNT_0008449025 /DNA_START=68 /DNA_END=388 /DNA_ORIENTATION=+
MQCTSPDASYVGAFGLYGNLGGFTSVPAAYAKAEPDARTLGEADASAEVETDAPSDSGGSVDDEDGAAAGIGLLTCCFQDGAVGNGASACSAPLPLPRRVRCPGLAE